MLGRAPLRLLILHRKVVVRDILVVALSSKVGNARKFRLVPSSRGAGHGVRGRGGAYDAMRIQVSEW